MEVGSSVKLVAGLPERGRSEIFDASPGKPDGSNGERDRDLHWGGSKMGICLVDSLSIGLHYHLWGVYHGLTW